MRIAFILPKLANQGPIIVAKDIIDNIKDRVDLIDVYYFDDVTEIFLDCNLYKISLFEEINFDKYDVVHSHMLRPDFYIWWHKKKSSTETLFISTLHQNIFDNLKGNYNRLIAFVFEKLWLQFLKKQDVVVTLTNVMKDYYNGNTQLNLKTIYNGRSVKVKDENLEESDFNFINQIKSKYKIIGSHCLLTKRKGINQIIKTLPVLDGYALVVIGDGQELDNLKALANELNVMDRCFFLGYKINAVAYLKYFDIYIMASYSEGFPLGLLEAGLNKLPVVSSDISIFRELFTEREVCFFELNNTSSLAAAIRLAYENKAELSVSLYQLILEKYTVDKMADNYMKLYSGTL